MGKVFSVDLKDSNGNKLYIQTPQVYQEAGYCYMYGFNTVKSYPKSGVEHQGVRCYRTKDLVNWEDIGNIIEPDETKYDSVLYPGNILNRPHIVYCKKTEKYVAWVHSDCGASQFYSVLIADRFTGPYTIVKEYYRPLDMNGGDFDVAVDEEGNGYFFFVRLMSSVIAARLSDDFLDVVEPHTTLFAGRKIPYAREGITHFFKDGRSYLITSGQTFFFPNQCEVAVADDPLGPYTILDDPYPNDPSKTSFCSQPADVIRMDGTDRYIVFADRWVPKFPKSRWFNRLFIKAYAHGARRITDDYFQNADPNARYSNVPHKGRSPIDLRKSQITILPVEFKGIQPVIDWKNNWEL